MTGEIQCTRLMHPFHELPENQEHQMSFFVFFLALNATILSWIWEAILILQLGWNFSCPLHILVCTVGCHSLRVLHSLILQRTAMTVAHSFIQIRFLYAPLTRDYCLLARVSYDQSMSVSHLVSYIIMVSKEVWNSLLAWAHLISRTHTMIDSLLLFADWTIINSLSYTALDSSSWLLRILLKREQFFKLCFCKDHQYY